MAESHSSQDELARKDSIEDIGEQMEQLSTDEAYNAKRDRRRDNSSSTSLDEALGLNDAVGTPIRQHNSRDIAIGMSQPLDSPQRLPDYVELNTTPNAQLTVETTQRRIKMADDVLARDEKDTGSTTRRKFLMWRELTREKRTCTRDGLMYTSLEGDYLSLKHDQEKLKAEAEQMKTEIWRMKQKIKSRSVGLAALKKSKEEHLSQELVVPKGL
ncbi:hypothetical protein LTR15_006950 [Elasticomyces elasticus]|nr:hypothetical protein LTR15_006950 [Elasticomyces elasticus]